MATRTDESRQASEREAEEQGGDGQGQDRPLNREEKRTLALLGLPTFALALSITTLTTYVPYVARQFLGSTAVIGVIVGIEGVMAVTVPLVVGTWSDRLRTRWGGRLPFLVVGTPVMAVALAVLGAIGSVYVLAVVVAVFFAFYYVAYEPYRALYPDAVPEDAAGRAQSTQALWRGVGTGLALVGGGVLVGLAQPLPFVVAAVILAVAMIVFLVVIVRRGVPDQQRDEEQRSVRDQARDLRRLVASYPALRMFLVANGLWEVMLGALKTFVFLYLTQGLGYSPFISAAIVGVTAVIILLGATVAGKAGDRKGRTNVLRVALPIYGLGLLIPFIFTARPVLAAAVPIVAFGGGFIMALPYAILIPLMPKGEHGALTGFYTFSRGLGIAVGPLLAGVAITVLKPYFSATQGYAAMWGVCGIAILASIPFLLRLRHYEQAGEATAG